MTRDVFEENARIARSAFHAAAEAGVDDDLDLWKCAVVALAAADHGVDAAVEALLSTGVVSDQAEYLHHGAPETSSPVRRAVMLAIHAALCGESGR